MRGKSPSKIKTRAIAARMEAPKSTYFLAGAATGAGATLPRMVLKKSELLGSKTMTSLFLAKLAL